MHQLQLPLQLCTPLLVDAAHSPSLVLLTTTALMVGHGHVQMYREHVQIHAHVYNRTAVLRNVPLTSGIIRELQNSRCTAAASGTGHYNTPPAATAHEGNMGPVVVQPTAPRPPSNTPPHQGATTLQQQQFLLLLQHQPAPVVL